MAKTFDKITSFVMGIVAALIGVGTGGLFLNGTFTRTWGLSLLPVQVHTVAGWIIIGVTLLGVVIALIRWLMKAMK